MRTVVARIPPRILVRDRLASGTTDIMFSRRARCGRGLRELFIQLCR